MAEGRGQVEEKVSYNSKAQSSGKALPVHLIEFSFFERLGERFLNGQAKGYADINYKQCLTINEDILTLDIAYVRDRYNHGIEHMLKIRSHGVTPDDNVGGVLWAMNFLCFIIQNGFDIHRVLTPRYENERTITINLNEADYITVELASGIFVKERRF